MRKEYNERQNAPLVNPGFTIDSNGVARELGTGNPLHAEKTDVENLLERGYHSNPRSLFIPTVDGKESFAS